MCLCVISCLNEGQVNEINFSRPCTGIALTDSGTVGLCVSVSVVFVQYLCHGDVLAGFHNHRRFDFRINVRIRFTLG